MEDIRLIACDLDGTLLQDGRKLPTARQLELVGELCDRGISFFAASGRQYASLRRLFEPVRDRIGYVCENGALVRYRGETLVCREVPRALALAVSHAVLDYPGANLLISTPSIAYAHEGDPAFLHELRDVVRNDVATYARPEEVDEPIIKMAFEVAHDAIPAATAHFQKLFGDKFSVVTSGNTWIDFLPFGVDKGTALAAAGERLGVPSAAMAAFGDNENDREMLAYVGHPYLMETCNPTMRDLPCVTYTPTVEDELERLLAGMIATGAGQSNRAGL